MNDAPSICLNKGNRTICGKDNGHHEGHSTSTIALPSSSDANERCPTPQEEISNKYDNALIGSSQQRGP